LRYSDLIVTSFY